MGRQIIIGGSSCSTSKVILSKTASQASMITDTIVHRSYTASRGYLIISTVHVNPNATSYP
jgi:hypothetical protein